MATLSGESFVLWESENIGDSATDTSLESDRRREANHRFPCLQIDFKHGKRSLKDSMMAASLVMVAAKAGM